MAHLQLGGAPPETVLPEPPPEAAEALRRASAQGSRQALSDVAARWPRYLAAWAALSRDCEAEDRVAAYAFARTGYHRGLDALRAAGWRGSGYVRWAQPSNRGFLECLESLGRIAEAIGEQDEARRCALFLVQLDPEGRDREGSTGRAGPGR